MIIDYLVPEAKNILSISMANCCMMR